MHPATEMTRGPGPWVYHSDVNAADQQVRYFQPSIGGRIAYSLIGSGPPLLVVPAAASHLEEIWKLEGQRAFCEVLGANHTLIHFDRWGMGLSDRDRDDFSFEADYTAMSELIDHLGLRRTAILGRSAGAPLAVTYSHRNPQRVSELVLYSPRIRRHSDAPLWAAMRQLMLADWTIATRTLAANILEGAQPQEIAAFASLLENASSAAVAVAFEETMSTVDVSPLLPELQVPTLVIARRDDTFFPVEATRRAAVLIPGARLAILEGRLHVELLEDTRRLVDAIAAFLRRPGQAMNGSAPLPITPRERQVLELIAAGLSNQEIAETLVLSVRTVERHAANIYAKIGVSSRTEAVAYAFRHAAVTA